MMDDATAGPQGASSERMQVLDEIVDLRAAQVGRSVVSVGFRWVKSSCRLAHEPSCRKGAVRQRSTSAGVSKRACP